MKRLLPVALVLSLGLVAAGTAEEPEVLQPCANPTGLEVLTLSGLSSDIATPTMPLWGVGLFAASAEQKEFVLDLAGQPLHKNSASVTVTLTWDIPVEDYDLTLYDAFGAELSHSENIQPLDGDSETVSGQITHCDEFTVESLNWTAAGASSLSLDMTAFIF